MVAAGLVGLKHSPSVHSFGIVALKQALATTLGRFKRRGTKTKQHRRLPSGCDEARSLSGVSRQEGVGPSIHSIKGSFVHTARPVLDPMKSPGDGFPRAVQRGPRHSRCRSNPTVPPPSTGGLGEALDGNVGPYRINVDRWRRCLLEPNHAGARRILISVRHRRGLHATSKRCKMIVPPGVQMSKEALGVYRADFDGQRCVAARTAPGKRPQPHETRNTR